MAQGLKSESRGLKSKRVRDYEDSVCLSLSVLSVFEFE